MARQWYIIHTYAGKEEMVKKNLEKRLKSLGMEDKIFRILIPHQKVSEIKDGKKVVFSKMYFPGYLFIEMELTDYSWHVVRNTPGISGFISSLSKPVPLSQEEVKRILAQAKEKKRKPKVALEVGDNVKVIRGPFIGFSGIIDEINEEKAKLKILVTIFGRSTPVEIGVDDVEKVEV
jgi:transcriptional antiterminator NusG